MSTFPVRAATRDDLPAIVDIYNEVIANSTAVYSLAASSIDERRAWFPMGKHLIIGGIDAANEGSLRLHERLGFERVAHFREVGRKFGRWLDLVFMQRFVDRAGADRAD